MSLKLIKSVFLLLTCIVLFSGCANHSQALVDEDYYCVVNANIIGFYNPVKQSCSKFGQAQNQEDDYCKKIQKQFNKGRCRPKSEACHTGKGDALMCINNRAEALRILLH